MPSGVYLRTEEWTNKYQRSPEKIAKIRVAMKGRNKGHTPWNKGIKGTHFSPATEFKPGMKVYFSEEHRRKISETRKRLIAEGKITLQHVHTPEFRNRMRELGKNRVWTEEMRHKISEAHKGRKPSPQTIEAVKIALKGYNHNEEVRKRIGQYSKAAWADPIKRERRMQNLPKGEAEQRRRKKISDKMRGENSHRWKGGITPLNFSIRHLMEYRTWQIQVIMRDNRTCQKCGRQRKAGDRVELEVHHIIPFFVLRNKCNIKTIEQAIKCDAFWDINNGLTLCKECHDQIEVRVNQYTIETRKDGDYQKKFTFELPKYWNDEYSKPHAKI